MFLFSLELWRLPRDRSLYFNAKICGDQAMANRKEDGLTTTSSPGPFSPPAILRAEMALGTKLGLTTVCIGCAMIEIETPAETFPGFPSIKV